MNAIAWAPLILYLVELTIKIVAIGTVPGNRRPSSSIAWLLLIVVTPILGLVLFLLIGSPFVRGRRAKIQAEANQVITGSDLPVPEATVLPAKHFTVDDMVGVIGSSNMDYRSFGLDYEITLMSTGKEFVADLQAVANEYRAVCHELTLAEWRARPKGQRYVDNVMRLVSALQ